MMAMIVCMMAMTVCMMLQEEGTGQQTYCIGNVLLGQPLQHCIAAVRGASTWCCAQSCVVCGQRSRLTNGAAAIITCLGVCMPTTTVARNRQLSVSDWRDGSARASALLHSGCKRSYRLYETEVGHGWLFILTHTAA
jgi:hypothetical protein